MSQVTPFLLVICDGFGYSPSTSYNAIAQAHTPYFDAFLAHNPHTLLHASGTHVGLPPYNPGNSEAGHLAIGTGRVTLQPVTRLLQAIEDGQFFANHVLTEGLERIKHGSNRLHIMGLLSDAGIHSHEAVLYAAIEAAQEKDIQEIFIHAFLDGRDTAPQSAATYLNTLDRYIKRSASVTLASISGRFYAMDRDGNWNRTQKSYRVLTEKCSPAFSSWQSLLEYYSAHGITDEFIPPTQLDNRGIVQQNDGIFFFNTRPDRARQLTQALTDPVFKVFNRIHIPLACFITPVSYRSLKIPTKPMLPEIAIHNTLTDILLAHDKTVFEIAETEKYAHVSYFFNGGREQQKPGESRVLIDSLNAKTYEKSPCMSAQHITQKVITSLQRKPHDFYVINYANADMVGHSGNYSATVQAIECLDIQLEALYEQAVQKMNGTLIITADHGKAEEMFDVKAGQPKTAHTSNKVPFVFITQEKSDISIEQLTSLTGIAPFILRYFGLPAPKEMTPPTPSSEIR